MAIGKGFMVGVTMLFILSGFPLPESWGQTAAVKPANVDFPPQMAKQFGWVIKRGGQEYLRLGQRIGQYQSDVVGVWVYGGLPFTPASLKVEGSLEKPVVIRIVGVKDKQFIPDPESLVPVYERFDPQDGKIVSIQFTQAANVTWQFVKSGLVFELEGKRYQVRKKGALVEFTGEGVKMDGLMTVRSAKPVRGK